MRKLLSSDISLALIVVVLVAMLRLLPVWTDIAHRGFDLLSTAGQPVPAEPGIVLVAIDEPSFSEIGLQWPWPREIHADLINALRAAGARTIGFDIVFAEESDPAADAALAAAAGPDIVFAADESLTESDFGTMLVRTEPFPALIEAGAISGIVSISLGGDGVARTVPAYEDGFALQLLEASGGEPVRNAGGDLIQYFGPAGTYPRISYYQALDPERFLPPDMLRDAVVIVGYNLQASPEVGETGVDVFESPYTLTTRRLMPGPELHATLFDNLRHGLSIQPQPEWLAWIALLLGVASGLAASRPQSPVSKLVLALGFLLVAVGTSWLSLRFGRFWVSPAEPAFAAVLTVMAIGGRDFAAEQRRRREIQGAFSQYVAPAVVEQLIAKPELLKLGGEQRELTILFADIRGFTAISEAMKDDPEALVRLINDVLTPLSDIVIAHGGTIDKYMGDCIMAFWNAPLDDPDHAMHALAASMAMRAAMPGINAALAGRMPRRNGEPMAIRIGIGLNTGRCVVGNMGSDQRFDYSALGDAVNTASRLEAKCKDYGVGIVIGQATANLVGDAVSLAEIDRIAVRGKVEAISVFTVEDAIQAVPGQ
ncbi:adenylate/guanylate cyclase domain-containing protein [Parasphingopyxis algicola]|uniref:CHASE2 domain-containing protein n=1 Tax=Parasphingopyxis algicola TaxID=2026624 RepID=UPI0015A02AFC|nr:adenylate/guanylate cyclase domain-containing protein [Parasphingopyxis algicola]QLC26034.1 adenylate/guanylate cyclase domain-containing protein [Parasphingopyxis algicola]